VPAIRAVIGAGGNRAGHDHSTGPARNWVALARGTASEAEREGYRYELADSHLTLRFPLGPERVRVIIHSPCIESNTICVGDI